MRMWMRMCVCVCVFVCVCVCWVGVIWRRGVLFSDERWFAQIPDSMPTISTGALTDNLTDKLLAMIHQKAQQKKVIDSLEFLMQLCSVSGDVRYRHWAISSVLLDMLLPTNIRLDSVEGIVVEDGLGQMDSSTVDQVLKCFSHNESLETSKPSIESVRERIGLPRPIDSDHNFEEMLEEILQIAPHGWNKFGTRDVIKGKYSNYFKRCNGNNLVPQRCNEKCPG